jgi:hypothetical protein
MEYACNDKNTNLKTFLSINDTFGNPGIGYCFNFSHYYSNAYPAIAHEGREKRSVMDGGGKWYIRRRGKNFRIFSGR